MRDKVAKLQVQIPLPVANQAVNSTSFYMNLYNKEMSKYCKHTLKQIHNRSIANEKEKKFDDINFNSLRTKQFQSNLHFFVEFKTTNCRKSTRITCKTF